MDASVAHDQHNNNNSNNNNTETSTQATSARAAATNTTCTPPRSATPPASLNTSTTPNSTPPATPPSAVAVSDSRAIAASPAAISNASSSSYNSPTDSSLLNTSNASVASPIPRSAAAVSAPAMSLGGDGAAVATLDDMKPKGELLPSTQKIKKLVRRNASDKLRLIHMVRDNPILWDSRMPNFKGAEEEKNRAWEHIGKEFNAPGRRVARAFKSLRESYRRELAHVKLMGSGFKPKWSLYEAMDFLRDVIRERKGGSHAVENAAIGFSLSAYSQQLHNNNNSKSALKYNPLHSLSSESALNLSKCAALNMSQDENYYGVKAELDMAAQSNGMVASAAVAAAAAAAALAAQHPMPAHQHPQQPTAQRTPLQHAPHDSRVTSTRNDSMTHNSTFEDMDASSGRSGDEGSMPNAGLSNQGSDEVEELEAIDADFPYPLILDSNSPRCAAGGVGGNAANGKRKHRGISMDGEGADEDDDYEGQMLQQHRHLRQQNGASGSGMSCMMDMAAGQTVREVLNSKFCGFISAKLNSMEDTEADNLMNKILMLLVQTQSNNESK